MFLLIAQYAIRALMLLIVVASVMSWFNPDPRNPAVKAVNAVVDPLLHPIRAILPEGLGIDFSPMVALLILSALQRLLLGGAFF